MNAEMKSYTSGGVGTAGIWTEFRNLFKGVLRAKKGIRIETEELIGEIRRVEASLKDYYGVILRGKHILEVGVGQLPRQVAYFGVHNRIVGIDLDVIPQGFRIWEYFQLLRSNGPKRLAKTVARKMMGMDREFGRQLLEILKIDRLPSVKLCAMDAKNMTFASNSFDFIYSFNVFEHLPDPAGVLKEIVRVLKPGGCVVCHFHLFTSDSGCHDVKILSGDRQNMPFWPHLRPRYQQLVENAAYINQLRIAQWGPIFESVLPGAKFELWKDPDLERLMYELDSLKKGGELTNFSDEELLTKIFVCYWQKPLE